VQRPESGVHDAAGLSSDAYDDGNSITRIRSRVRSSAYAAWGSHLERRSSTDTGRRAESSGTSDRGAHGDSSRGDIDDRSGFFVLGATDNG